MGETERAQLVDDLAELVGYLVVSASGLLDEPAAYGPFRLIDGAGRLVAALDRHGLSSPRLDLLRDGIEAGKATSMGTPEEFRDFLNELVMLLVEED